MGGSRRALCGLQTPGPVLLSSHSPKSSKPSTYHTRSSQNYELRHQLISNLSDLCLLLYAFIFLGAILAAEEEVMEGGRLVICWWSNDLLLLHQTISRDNGGQEEAPGLPTLSPLHSALHWNTQIQTLKNAYTNMEIDKYTNWKIQTQTMKYKSANVDKDANSWTLVFLIHNVTARAFDDYNYFRWGEIVEIFFNKER